MKTTPIILGLLGLAASAVAFTAMSDGADTSVVQEKKTDEAKKSPEKEKKAEKVTVWIMDSTGSG